jgi:hypothetical protein
MLFAQGGVVDATSFAPNPMALSTAESEHNAAAFGVTAAQHVRQLFQELHGLLPDTQLFIPLVMDSSSAIAIASKSCDARHARHIQRRIHFARFGNCAMLTRPCWTLPAMALSPLWVCPPMESLL